MQQSYMESATAFSDKNGKLLFPIKCKQDIQFAKLGSHYFYALMYNRDQLAELVW